MTLIILIVVHGIAKNGYHVGEQTGKFHMGNSRGIGHLLSMEQIKWARRKKDGFWGMSDISKFMIIHRRRKHVLPSSS